MRMRITIGFGLSLLAGMGSVAGCSTASYNGYSPSARTFSESPGMRDYYVGMNLNFSVDRQTEYHRAASADTGTALAVPASPLPAQTSAAPVAAVN